MSFTLDPNKASDNHYGIFKLYLKLFLISNITEPFDNLLDQNVPFMVIYLRSVFLC